MTGYTAHGGFCRLNHRISVPDTAMTQKQMEEKFMGKYTELQREAYEANMHIPAQHLALYTWGNVSAFDKAAGVFAIKPSGVPYPELTPESMVIVDLEGNVVEGNLRPSSDTPTHAVIFR